MFRNSCPPLVCSHDHHTSFNEIAPPTPTILPILSSMVAHRLLSRDALPPPQRERPAVNADSSTASALTQPLCSGIACDRGPVKTIRKQSLPDSTGGHQRRAETPSAPSSRDLHRQRRSRLLGESVSHCSAGDCGSCSGFRTARLKPKRRAPSRVSAYFPADETLESLAVAC